jgi:hypothetical protein
MVEFFAQFPDGRQAFAEHNHFVALAGHVLQEVGGYFKFGGLVIGGYDIGERPKMFGSSEKFVLFIGKG